MPDIMSTGFSGAESGGVRVGDTVAVFAQGPIGLCATGGARLMGASRIIVVDGVPGRLETARRLGADYVVDFDDGDPVAAIMDLTGGRGVDVAIEALGIRRPSRTASRSCARAARCLALGSIRAISGSRSARSAPGSPTSRSSPRSARAVASEGSNATDDDMAQILEDYADDPTLEELRSFLEALNDDEIEDLLALTWLGRDDYSIDDWDEIMGEVRDVRDRHTIDYLLGTPLLAEYLESGLAAFGLSCEEFELGHM